MHQRRKEQKRNLSQGSRDRKTNLPYYRSLPEDYLDPALLIRLTYARCLEWHCLPICEDDSGITIATHAEQDFVLRAEQLRGFFPKRIQWVICPESYLIAAVHRAFGFYTR